jgi:hypothetical protein
MTATAEKTSMTGLSIIFDKLVARENLANYEANQEIII